MKLANMHDSKSCGASLVGSSPTLGTSKEIASFEGSPRFARRLIRIGFWGQKRIGDFLKHGSSRLFSEMLSFPLCFRSELSSRLDSRIKQTHEPVRAKTAPFVQNLLFSRQARPF